MCLTKVSKRKILTSFLGFYNMKKNVVLIVAGAGDFFFGSNSTKPIDKKEKLLGNIQDIISRGNFKAVTNVTTPHETTKEINVYKGVRPQAVVKMTLHADELLHKNNELSLTSLDNEELLFDGDQLDFIFPAEAYDIHLCGVDINGTFKGTIEKLLNKGFNVTVYSDAIRPFKNTHKYIASLQNSAQFRYCSYKSV